MLNLWIETVTISSRGPPDLSNKMRELFPYSGGNRCTGLTSLSLFVNKVRFLF